MQQPSNPRAPFQEGFAALREEPLLLSAEVAWRWCFGLAAWLLILVAAALFLDSLKVSDLDRFLLSTMQPLLEWSALNHILHGALLRAIWIKFIVITGIDSTVVIGSRSRARSLVAQPCCIVRRRRPRRRRRLAILADAATSPDSRSVDVDRPRLPRCLAPYRNYDATTAATVPCCILLRLWNHVIARLRRGAELVLRAGATVLYPQPGECPRRTMADRRLL